VSWGIRRGIVCHGSSRDIRYTISFGSFAVAKAVFTTLPASIRLSDRVRSFDCTIRSSLQGLQLVSSDR
jgi:hypothetical protein